GAVPVGGARPVPLGCREVAPRLRRGATCRLVAVAQLARLLVARAHGDLPGGSVSLRSGFLRLGHSRPAQGLVQELQGGDHLGAPRSVCSTRYGSRPGVLLDGTGTD